MLENLHISAEELAIVRDKRQRLQEALEGRAAAPESVTHAMLDCGRQGDFETLLEQNRRVKQGVEGFYAERQRGLEGRDTAWLEPVARDLTDQLVNEAKILWVTPSAAQAAADADPYLTAAALNWAQEEGDICSELPPELFGAQSAAAGQAAKCLIESDWDWQEFWSQVLETVAETLLMVSTGFMMAGFVALAAEASAATVGALVAASWGVLIAGAVVSAAGLVVEECWDELQSFFEGAKQFWKSHFNAAETREEAAGRVASPAAAEDAAEPSYA